MLSKGRLRAEQYSMLGKSQSNFSEKSVMSSGSKRKDGLVSGHLSPLRKTIHHSIERSMSSTKRSGRNRNVFKSQDVSSGQFQKHIKNIARPVEMQNLNQRYSDKAALSRT